MVRTKLNNTAKKVVAAKAPRKNVNAGSSSSTSPTSAAKGSKHAGGNPYCPRPTPDWQKEITTFFVKTPKTRISDKENQEPEDDGAGSSSKMEEDVPVSSKTNDKSKIKKSKKQKREVREAETEVREAETEVREAETEEVREAETEEKMEEDKETEEENGIMEVEIEIVDKKDTPKKVEETKPFTKNNCISDSEEDD